MALRCIILGGGKFAGQGPGALADAPCEAVVFAGSEMSWELCSQVGKRWQLHGRSLAVGAVVEDRAARLQMADG